MGPIVPSFSEPNKLVYKG